tara:strand:+ start:58 stop:357 length:300 start_codon:yes stop_codon:yes gene_type:complete
MIPQNPFNTWENSDEYYNLQDEIGKIKIQQSEYDKIAPNAPARRGFVHDTDPHSLEFKRKLRSLEERSRQGKFNFNFQKQHSIGSSQSSVNGAQPKFNF